MSGSTQQYYESRSHKEWEMAAAATDPEIAAIHVEMAKRYDTLVEATKLSTLRIVASEMATPLSGQSILAEALQA
jgi:hypothetical protein